MKKAMWITGGLVLICAVVLAVYFAFFREKDEEPHGTFVKGMEVTWQQNA
ncbi:MAG: hypothetical protein IJY09_05905 [Lachnospiraceae bacterium]|nr:hypothetical protein [Lachnospiraceae bacterium]